MVACGCACVYACMYASSPPSSFQRRTLPPLNTNNTHRAPIHYAARKMHAAAVLPLVREMGVNPSQVNEWGDTPLHTLLRDIGHLYVALASPCPDSKRPDPRPRKAAHLTPAFPPPLTSSPFHSNTHTSPPFHSQTHRNSADALKTVKKLVEAGADLRVQNKMGDNVLHLAGHKKVRSMQCVHRRSFSSTPRPSAHSTPHPTLARRPPP